MDADVTVTFIVRKQGLYTGDGPGHAGDVVLADLAVPGNVLLPADGELASIEHPGARLPQRGARDHKGRFGHVVVVGGDHGYAGAASLAAQAAARVGAGRVSLLTRPEHVSAIVAACPEVMVRGVECDEVSNAKALELLNVASAIAVGPGLGRAPWGQNLLEHALGARAQLILDADALNLLAVEEALVQALRSRAGVAVITPHPGEAARLLGLKTSAVESDRFAAAEQLSSRLGVVTLLKGAGTVVQGPEGPPVVCATGHPAMASGGMGDVLSGVVAGLVAQGMAAMEATVIGALAHGEAARAQVHRRGIQRGLLASDLLHELPMVVSRL